MDFTDVLLVMAKALESVHKDEHDALATAMLYAFRDVDQLSSAGHDVILNAVDEHDDDFIEALIDLLNEDGNQ